MKEIRKVAAVVIKENTFMMVRKAGKDVWTSLGGRPEEGESDEQALLREIKEEVNCDAEILQVLGEIVAPAIYDDARLTLSCFLVNLIGNPIIRDGELEEFRFISEQDFKAGIKLPESITDHLIPLLVSEGLLDWSLSAENSLED